ncbi:PREDICTED: carbon catabolite repressor protein 4 homolog 3 isoform X2 [Fragaria vesca subsp. vesca]|uniref:carbon catabolite repressor protein 4 homolog 3 isoform X2 n=1 Tax=Fragaria vesca subsp. vesca TaxID=101020 RepID=UPI0002C32006|nr:PREDICTED: carbon catabolite repressor protein 4 homolog 3 isoform X2 [Fragaria vesca subsp. vesca]
MRCDAASSWLYGRHVSVAPAIPTAGTSFLFLCRPAVSCCTNTPNPLKRRYSGSSHAPDIVRRWIQSDHPLASQDRFTVASYNILGDRNAFAHRDMYGNVPSMYLKWDHRKRVICDEISAWNSHIVCLQEVDKYLELSNNLAKLGYAGSYKRRTGDTVDGCATFWKSHNLRLLDEESIEFKGYGLRDNVAQLSVFEMHKDKSRKLVIGNIHVLYSPSRGEIKLGQIRFLLSRAHILSERWGNAPVVLCGDFNSTPQSAIYKFLSTSELNIMSYDRTELSGQKSCHPAQVLGVKQRTSSPLNLIDGLLKHSWTDEEIRVATGNSGSHSVVHPLKLNSSYAMVQGSTATRGSSGEPLATSYHSKFLGTVDYLWYSDGLVPTGVLDTVSLDTLQRIGSLPCKKVGSDHLALVSEFAFTPGTKEGNNTTASTI